MHGYEMAWSYQNDYCDIGLSLGVVKQYMYSYCLCMR